MNTVNDSLTAKNLTRSQQASRLILAFSLISIAMTAPVSSLGIFAWLPLLAIYPLVTGVTGWDPLFQILAVDSRATDDATLKPAARRELAVTGVTLVGSAFVIGDASGTLSLLPLAGIFPALTALLGEDLLQTITLPADQLTHAQHAIEFEHGTGRELPELNDLTSESGEPPKKAA